MFERDLRGAGFSTRTIHGLVYGAEIKTLEELRERPWDDEGDRRGLRWWLSVTPNLGPKGIAEVVAFRAGLDPRQAKAPDPTKITLAFDTGELAALDAWIANQASSMSRQQAIRTLLAAGLHSMRDPKT